MDKATEAHGSPLVDGVPTPRITLTPAALDAVRAARGEGDGPFLRLEISSTFEHSLFFDDEQPGDVVVRVEGLGLVLDRESAGRANDLHVDYVKEGEREGFKIENPNRKRTERAASHEPPPKPPRPERPPEIVVTDAARAQFLAALAEEEGDGHSIKVSARRMGATKVDYELGIISPAEKGEEDFELDLDGLRFAIDPYSARTLDGATIDFVDSGSASGFKFSNPRIERGWEDPRAAQLEELLEKEINPSIAAHGGVVELLDLVGDIAYVMMGGGCHGCGMAAVTLQQGIQERVDRALPGVRLVDTTDHASGENPYYRASH